VAAPHVISGMENRVSVSRQIPVQPGVLFGILTEPANHPLIDGSGMIREAVSDTAIAQVGDVFIMKMSNEQFGDYEMTSHVVEYEPDRLIAWEPVMSDAAREEVKANVGFRTEHRWTYELTSAADGSTLVTETYDCSRAPAWMRAATSGGELWSPAMTESLGKLEQMATEQATRPPA
jgi:uncharacterized protein YndB with AHSA1/START domain